MQLILFVPWWQGKYYWRPPCLSSIARGSRYLLISHQEILSGICLELTFFFWCLGIQSFQLVKAKSTGINLGWISQKASTSIVHFILVFWWHFPNQTVKFIIATENICILLWHLTICQEYEGRKWDISIINGRSCFFPTYSAFAALSLCIRERKILFLLKLELTAHYTKGRVFTSSQARECFSQTWWDNGISQELYWLHMGQKKTKDQNKTNQPTKWNTYTFSSEAFRNIFQLFFTFFAIYCVGTWEFPEWTR